jgi:quinolinate synthase
MFEWALRPASEGGAGAERILALPDEHLAHNTAIAMGYSQADCVVYDPRKVDGGLRDDDIQSARFILWKGHCYVHQRFTVAQVQAVRKQTPGIRVIVHPECPRAVVQAADESGSTEQILRVVNASPAGSQWAIGTEANMVYRLAANNPDKFVRVLSDAPPLCVMMDRIDPPHLLWVLENLCQGRVVNRISVEPSIAANARLALEKMLENGRA